MTEHREGQPQPVDLSEDFMNLSDSEFADKLQRLAGSPLEIRIPISLLGANVYEFRLKRFLMDKSSPRRAVVEARSWEKETFEKRFPGVEWKITDRP